MVLYWSGPRVATKGGTAIFLKHWPFLGKARGGHFCALPFFNIGKTPLSLNAAKLKTDQVHPPQQGTPMPRPAARSHACTAEPHAPSAGSWPAAFCPLWPLSSAASCMPSAPTFLRPAALVPPPRAPRTTPRGSPCLCPCARLCRRTRPSCRPEDGLPRLLAQRHLALAADAKLGALGPLSAPALEAAVPASDLPFPMVARTQTSNTSTRFQHTTTSRTRAIHSAALHSGHLYHRKDTCTVVGSASRILKDYLTDG
jgi:hypothetical protein